LTASNRLITVQKDKENLKKQSAETTNSQELEKLKGLLSAKEAQIQMNNREIDELQFELQSKQHNAKERGKEFQQLVHQNEKWRKQVGRELKKYEGLKKEYDTQVKDLLAEKQELEKSKGIFKVEQDLLKNQVTSATMMAKENQKTFNKIQKDKVETEKNLADKVRNLEAEKMRISKMKAETEQAMKELKSKEET